MRVSTLASYTNGLTALQRLQVALDHTQRQISSGKRLLTPADDPIGSARALDLRERLSRIEQFDRNIVVAQNRLRDEEATLSNFNNTLQRVRELALQANNSTINDESRLLIATEMRQNLSQLVDLANAKNGMGEYLFSGNSTDTLPVTSAAGSYGYNGDQGGRVIAISDSREIADGNSGDDVFFRIRVGNGTFVANAAPGNTGTGVVGQTSVVDATQYDNAPYDIVFVSPTDYEVRDAASAVIATGTYQPGDAIAFRGVEVSLTGDPAVGDQFSVNSSPFQSVFQSVSDLIAAVETTVTDDASRAVLSNGVNRGLENLDQAIGNVLDVQTRIGARLGAIESQVVENDAASLAVQDSLGDIEDLDYAEALSRLSQQAATLEAAQKSFVATQRLLLFDLI